MNELISVTEHGSVTVLTLTSTNVDATNVAELERELTELISETHCQLVLDMSQLNFISSAGLRSLLITAKSARRHGGDLRLANATPTVQRILLLVGMQDIFRLFVDIPSAIESFG